MAYEQFENFNFKEASLATLETADSIIREYRQKYDMGLTLRQLYYQFVARDLLENTQRNYNNLGTLITKGRKAGVIDWSGIHDEGRSAKRRWGDQTPEAVVDNISSLLIIDPWKDQDAYVEVWIEKHGMAGTISKVCDDRRVTWLTCGGYVSASEAYKGGKRFRQAAEAGKRPVLIHLGDHDPSGLDMTRDNGDRIGQFGRIGSFEYGYEDLSQISLDVQRIALNYPQIEEHSPPPNPAKMTDSRAADYVAEHGYSSWELDALSPDIIRDILDAAIMDYVSDYEEFTGTFEREERAKEHLDQLHGAWGDVTDFLDAREKAPGRIIDEINDILEEG